MNKIKIKNFGPIKSGYEANNGFMEINKISIFIGNQGTGKSSIAKLISTLSWLEKALYRGEIKENYVVSYNRFVNQYCNYQNLKNYFLDDTEIEYVGKVYSFKFKDNKLSVIPLINKNSNTYRVPKIMYVPAERNFLSAVENPEKLKGLPQSLFTFWEELDRSQQELSESLTLPFGNVKFEFDKLNKISKIVGDGFKLRLSEASSGFQSFVPLYLVSRNLALSINRERDTSKQELSGEEQKRLKQEIEKILSNDKLSDELKSTALELLSSKFRNESFLNIVEEIEQNLYPSSQRKILFELFKFANTNLNNQLILTTHSPYIINYLTLSIKADDVLSKISKSNNSELLKNRLNKIVPIESCIGKGKSFIYELNEDGSIIKLAEYEGLPSDNNYLNQKLADANLMFDQLLEIEEEIYEVRG